MPILFDDPFVATPGDLLDGINGWSVTSNAGGAPTINPSGVLSMGGFLGASFAVQPGISVADPTILAPLTLAASCGIGLVFRYKDANNYYFVDFLCDGTLGAIAIACYKVVAGSLAEIGTVVTGASIAPGVAFTAGVGVSGTNFTARNDGTDYFTFVDGSIVGAGAVGLRNGGGGSGTRTLARFTVSTAGSPTVARNRSRRIQRSRRPW